MLLVLFLACIVSFDIRTTCAKSCNCHYMTVLYDLPAPFGNKANVEKIGILHSENRLYFTFERSSNEPDYYKVGFVNFETGGGFGIMNGSKPINNYGTFDIDQKDNSILVASCDEMKNVFIYNGIELYVRKSDGKFVEKKGNDFAVYEQYKTVESFVVNDNDVLVFTNKTGLYADVFGTDVTICLSKKKFSGLTIDLNSVIYAWLVDTIYKVVMGEIFEETSLVKLTRIPGGLDALTFDADNNLVFNSGRTVYTLIPLTDRTC